MIKNVLLSLNLCTAVVYADSGFYIGAGAGYGSMTASTTNGYNYLDGTSSKNGNNMLGSVYMGYDFSHFVGTQIDYDYIANAQFTSSTSSITGVQNSFSVNEQVIDLAVTGHLPFSVFANSLSGASIFGKLGVGYSIINFSGGTVGSGVNQVFTQSLPTFAQGLVPVLGIGAEYGIGSVGIRLEYNYIGTITVSNGGQNVMNINNSIGLFSAFYHF